MADPENPTPEQFSELEERIRKYESGTKADLQRQIGSAFERLNGKVTAVNCSIAGAPSGRQRTLTQGCRLLLYTDYIKVR